MSFAVFADGSANLPKKMLDGITLWANRRYAVYSCGCSALGYFRNHDRQR